MAQGPVFNSPSRTVQASQITPSTGSGSVVLSTSPTLVTPNIGVATATSINGNTVTAGTGTVTIQAGKTLSYEEGTWTAAMAAGSSGTITINTSFRTGTYIKIGRQVTVTGYLAVTSVSSPVGAFTITGLPYAPVNSTQNRAGCSVWANGLAAAAVTSVQCRILENGTALEIAKWAAGNVSAMAADVQASADFSISATYFTN